jgi:hypothetical protein
MSTVKRDFRTHIDNFTRQEWMDKATEKRLKALFKRKQVLSLEQILEITGSKSTRTIFRYLERLGYLSSYTDTHSYYTLQEIVQFDQNGFWHYGEIGFSKYGGLKETLLHLVNSSDSGRTHSELEVLQKCRAHNALRELVKTQKLHRKSVENTYVYTAADPKKSAAQLEHRSQFPQGEPSMNAIIDILLTALLVLQTPSGVLTVQAVAHRLQEKKSSVLESEVLWVFHKYKLEKKTPHSSS